MTAAWRPESDGLVVHEEYYVGDKLEVDKLEGYITLHLPTARSGQHKKLGNAQNFTGRLPLEPFLKLSVIEFIALVQYLCQLRHLCAITSWLSISVLLAGTRVLIEMHQAPNGSDSRHHVPRVFRCRFDAGHSKAEVVQYKWTTWKPVGEPVRNTWAKNGFKVMAFNDLLVVRKTPLKYMCVVLYKKDNQYKIRTNCTTVAGKTITQITIPVQAPTMNASTEIVRPATASPVRRGENVTLICRTKDTNVNAKLSWWRQGKNLYETLSDGDFKDYGYGKLILIDVTERHKGRYTCFASVHGKKANFTLSIQAQENPTPSIAWLFCQCFIWYQ